VAVSTPKGLVVPVLRDVDQMSFADVEMVSWATGANLCAAGRCVADGSREAMAALGAVCCHPASHFLLSHWQSQHTASSSHMCSGMWTCCALSA
jgi:hypothetical protein